MIISHKYRYLFIEIPVTGSYAIHQELCKYYDGHPILHKHATYPEFRGTATRDEQSYFVFASVRNPLDTTVSAFFKYKTNHKGAYSDTDASIQSDKIDYADIRHYESLKDPNATLESVFLKPAIWERPYSNMIEISSDYLDFVIRYENLAEDFAEVLRLLGIKQIRPVPIVNKTQGRDASWKSYYTPKMIEKAKRVYGPFMQKWGYEFPESWGDHCVSHRKMAEFHLVNMMKKTYLIHFRYNHKIYAKFVRLLNAELKKIM